MQFYAVVATLTAFAGVAIASDSCVKEDGQCYFPGVGSKGCCEGLICAGDRCRDPSTADSCVKENGQCYFPGVGSKGCCEGLICAGDRCRDVSNM